MTDDAVCVLLGETAVGKSGLALALARGYGAEIVGADSRQIYRGMEIGTAAPDAADRASVPHHLTCFLDPRERYSAARFCREAQAAIDAAAARGRRAIVVGGTGFYLRALTGEMRLGAPADAAIAARVRREERLHDPAWLHAWLRLLDPARAARLHENDVYRVGQALERALARRAATRSATVREDAPPPLARPYRKFRLERDPADLEERIVRRVDAMLEAGFLEEAERVGLDAAAATAVGYDHAFAYLRGQATAEELRGLLVRATRRYAKRQRTWLRREADCLLLDGARPLEELCATMAAGLGWARRAP